MVNLLFFILGAIAGGFLGVVAMCIFTVSSMESRREERERK